MVKTVIPGVYASRGGHLPKPQGHWRTPLPPPQTIKTTLKYWIPLFVLLYYKY